MMNARRVALVAAAALGLVACVEVTQEDLPSDLVFATFVSPNIPAPNDLVLRAVPTLTAPEAAAQKQFLQAFIDAGGFPSDQEVTISIPFRAVKWNATTRKYDADAAPTIDPATVTTATVKVLKLNGTAAPTPVEYDIADADPVTAGVQTAPGVLTLRRKADAAGSRRWDAGARYVFAVRGGASGVKTTTGKSISTDSAIALAIPNRDLTKKENQPLGAIPDSNASGSNADEIALLEGVRQALWAPVNWKATGGAWAPDTATPALSPFQAIASAWPIEDTASVAAFNTAPSAGPVLLIDSGSGVVPLPIDLLRTDADGTVITNPAFGPAAAGLTTLDGFSTTAMMLAQASSPLDASTINGANVLVYTVTGTTTKTATMVPELKAVLGGGGNPATAGYVAQPSQLVVAQGAACPIAGGCSVAIGLQPAVPAPVNATTTIYLPPLRSNTTYAVVVTNRVKGVTGAAMAKPTVGKILLDMTAPAASGTPGDTTGVSLLSGVSADTARSLRDMKANLEPVWAALPAGTTKADVALAYTFKTQTVPNVSLQLAALPYSVEKGAAAAVFSPTAATAFTPPAGVPTTGVAGFYNVKFKSVDAIDKTTGALNPALSTTISTPAGLASVLVDLNAYVAVPNPANVPNACPGTGGAVKCAPLVIFGHGLNGSKDTMLAVASGLAQAGFVVAAIDFPLHGERNWCNANSQCDNAGADGVCTAFTGAAGQGDAAPPGTCTTGTTKVFSAPGVGIGSRYFVSANFFRTRDAFRQNVLDQSALGLALARPPSPLAPQPAANPFAAAALGLGVAVDPTQIFYEGISLGSIAGTSVLATNPRITRASLSVGGGTITDVFTNSPAFQANVDALFATLIPGYTRAKITAGDPAFDAAIAASYLRTLNVAKWILDPGDPINYAQHVKLAPLPNLLADQTGATPQTAKAALGQIAKNDAVVPNPFNLLLYNVMSADQTFYDSGSAAGGSVSHGILASSATVQGHAAGFLLGTVPPTTVTLP